MVLFHLFRSETFRFSLERLDSGKNGLYRLKTKLWPDQERLDPFESDSVSLKRFSSIWYSFLRFMIIEFSLEWLDSDKNGLIRLNTKVWEV